MIGLARDGHLVYGPYDLNEELWSSDDHDICNGTYLDDNSYAYVSTAYFPYNIGCWGQNEKNCVGPFEDKAIQLAVTLTGSLLSATLYLT